MTRRTTFVALTAAGLALALGGCHYASNPGSSSGGSTGGGNGGNDVHSGGTGKSVACDATFLPSGNTTGIDIGASLKGTLWVKCTTTPTEHHLILQLEVDVPGSGWKVKETRPIDKIPPSIYQPMVVSTPCIPGEWRLTWSVTGTVNGQPFAGSATGQPRTVEVDDCA